MSSALGVSVGTGAIRLARPPAGAATSDPQSFELRTFVVPSETPSAERAALSVAAALNSDPGIARTVLACRDELQAEAVHVAMTEHGLDDYDIVPDIEATLEFATASGALAGVSTLGVYDLGASGLSVTVVEVAGGQIVHTERTGDISGEYFDSLIREQQINSGRIAHPPDPDGLARLDTLCRSAKEKLSGTSAVALPSDYGPVLLTQENFTALIARAVETSVHSTREVIGRSGRPVQAVLAVGGGVRIPLVSRTLREILEMPVLVPPEPEAATARGAALLAQRAPESRAAAVPQRPGSSAPPLVAAAAQATDTPASPPAPQAGIFGAELESPPAAPDDAATKATVVAPAVSRPKMPMPQPGIFGPPAGSAVDLPADSVARTGPATERPGPDKYSSGTAAVPQTVAAHPVLSTAPQLTPEEDPPTIALRIPQKLLPRRSFREPPQRRRRELGAAAVAVSALAVVAAIGIGLGYGQHMFRQESTTVEGTTPPPASSATSPTARPGMAGASLTTAPEHESLAEPPPVAAPRETETPTTTTGPNTFQVPGLPPIVLPTIPPLFPPPPSR
ncbi:Hsp70 family protein [Nocardia zapadnayensis]|uniref:Hsp70 family protein n=1 Tax=Nocardia rhamnosiphila TaxID=426716 RepID=UPI0022472AA6|nr:Hsp70 family protein [Nocardia zapadnayensis]MCX0270540.1 Hsp70 family protein [Nocardia zapadnayensis]